MPLSATHIGLLKWISCMFIDIAAKEKKALLLRVIMFTEIWQKHRHWNLKETGPAQWINSMISHTILHNENDATWIFPRIGSMGSIFLTREPHTKSIHAKLGQNLKKWKMSSKTNSPRSSWMLLMQNKIKANTYYLDMASVRSRLS